MVKPVECIQLVFRANAGRPKTTINPGTKVQAVFWQLFGYKKKCVKHGQHILEYLERDRGSRASASAKTTGKWSLHRALKIPVGRGVIRKL
jgi:hypothetical protein